MKILILEGIATSGKTTIIAGLQKRLSNLNVRVVGEPETHIPIMKQASDLHVEFFEALVNRLVAKAPDLIIFDRLYLTQAFRAGASLNNYASVEAALVAHGAVTVFLKVEVEAIADRVAKAAQHREVSWGDYIKTKGGNMDEIAYYYANQQQSQLKLLEASKLPHMVCDTTTHNYDEVLGRILSKLEIV